MYSITPQIQPIIPSYHVNILSDSQLTEMKSATLEVLEEVGVHCPSKKALDIYADHGCMVDIQKQTVKLPADVVLEAMSRAPRAYIMGGRSVEYDLILDGTRMYCATDGCGVETIDFKTGQRRASVKEDVAKMARVADYLPFIGFYWPMVSAQDYPPTAPLHELDASFSNTVKHVQTPTVVTERVARYAVEMAGVIAGDKNTLQKRPPLSLLICTIAPLAQDKESMEAALVFAEAGLPVGFMSMALGGSTAPATVPGTVLVGDAEIVSAMVLMQLAYPGTPTYHSLMPGIMHPRTGDFLGSTPEAFLIYSVGVELAHMWGVPTLAGVGAEAATSSWESALGVASSMLLCALCGAETVSGLGLRETCTLLTPESLVLDSEIYNMVLSSAAGLSIDKETLAIDIIKKVGPGGHFLNQPHTREHLRKRVFSDLTFQLNPGGGYRDPIEVAIEKTEWILENHYPEPLLENQKKEIQQILKAADRELE
jgi:trimethylamine--corrinoid protein Co-methyltransferase